MAKHGGPEHHFQFLIYGLVYKAVNIPKLNYIKKIVDTEDIRTSVKLPRMAQ